MGAILAAVFLNHLTATGSNSTIFDYNYAQYNAVLKALSKEYHLDR